MPIPVPSIDARAARAAASSTQLQSCDAEDAIESDRGRRAAIHPGCLEAPRQPRPRKKLREAPVGLRHIDMDATAAGLAKCREQGLGDLAIAREERPDPEAVAAGATHAVALDLAAVGAGERQV